jgi:hypothetical protein
MARKILFRTIAVYIGAIRFGIGGKRLDSTLDMARKNWNL